MNYSYILITIVLIYIKIDIIESQLPDDQFKNLNDQLSINNIKGAIQIVDEMDDEKDIRELGYQKILIACKSNDTSSIFGIILLTYHINVEDIMSEHFTSVVDARFKEILDILANKFINEKLHNIHEIIQFLKKHDKEIIFIMKPLILAIFKNKTQNFDHVINFLAELESTCFELEGYSILLDIMRWTKQIESNDTLVVAGRLQQLDTNINYNNLNCTVDIDDVKRKLPKNLQIIMFYPIFIRHQNSKLVFNFVTTNDGSFLIVPYNLTDVKNTQKYRWRISSYLFRERTFTISNLKYKNIKLFAGCVNEICSSQFLNVGVFDTYNATAIWELIPLDSEFNTFALRNNVISEFIYM